MLERVQPPAAAPARRARGELLRDYLEGLGLEFAMEAEAESVDANGRLRGVPLTDGRRAGGRTSCSSPPGSGPNVELARAAGLHVTAACSSTSACAPTTRTVLAAGDVAEYGGQHPGPVADGRGAGRGRRRHAAGGDKAYQGIVPVTILKVVGIELTSIGRFERPRRTTR